MKRPRFFNLEIRDQVAQSLVPTFQKELQFNSSEKISFAKDLSFAIGVAQDSDGFAVAVQMQKLDWYVDTSFVLLLKDLPELMSKAFKEHFRHWAKGIEPVFKVGDLLIVGKPRSWQARVSAICPIVRIDYTRVEYVVEGGPFDCTVPFEEAVPA